MFYAKLENGIPTFYPLKEKDVRKSLENVSLPVNLTNEILEPFNFIIVEEGSTKDFPVATKNLKIVIDSIIKKDDGTWNRTYKLVPITGEDYTRRLNNRWLYIREKRDKLMADFEWRISRCRREQDLGLTTTDNIDELNLYMQQLADITKQPDPFLIVFPTQP